jgi:hypothetical protein
MSNETRKLTISDMKRLRELAQPWDVNPAMFFGDTDGYEDALARAGNHNSIAAIVAAHLAASDRTLRERNELKAALERIAANRYGHQGLVEDGASDAEIASYYAQVVSELQRIARTALAALSTEA